MSIFNGGNVYLASDAPSAPVRERGRERKEERERQKR